ncbi:MAG TPA: hypothetical protein RMH99_01320 [Sandaracinaceae bacterium LLY-WYZ-13_1]|nr:hypothetical protein [Sandaracinaceae bacterium LLY-WYZ-13_1]
MGNIFEHIRRDHETIRSMLKATCEAESEEGRVARQGEMMRALRVHDDAEHSSLYSALLGTQRGEELGTEAAEAHRRIEQALDDLIATPPGDIAHRVRLRDLKNRVELHFDWEQAQLFPAAHFLLSPRTMRALGDIYLRAKRDAETIAA